MVLIKRNIEFGLIAIFMIMAFTASAQSDKDKGKADKLFSIKNYEGAIEVYKQVIEGGEADTDTYYKMGKSYFGLEDVNNKIKSIEYFEKAIELGLEPIPFRFYRDLGDAYFLNEQISQALKAFNEQLIISKDEKSEVNALNERIRQVSNAQKEIQNKKKIDIFPLGNTVNTAQTEYNPVVSADESIMAFTALRENDTRERSGDKYIEKIFISYNQTGNWSTPEEVKLPTINNIGTAGMASDGQEMLVFISEGTSAGSLYTITKDGNEWGRPVALSGGVNSKYLESTASITPDGKTIYFASNRPGGYGGMDIYKAEKGENGEWGKVTNLGKTINSKNNEDAPFIHPDMRTLFFTSDGPECIGGTDIFTTTLEGDVWKEPKNMGYPINTPANDSYFTLIADGTRGYFSSDRKGGQGGQDIYMFNMPEDYGTIPLTMIKGRILDAETDKPIATKIYVIDNATHKKLEYVYHPNKETGDYLVILPPNKNYDMIIESDGFMPYTLNIDVPNQDYFYELFQKIYLKTIRQFDVVVGQEIEVKNAFYDTHNEQKTDIRKEREAALIQTDSIDVYELMSSLIEASDQSGIDYLVELILLSDPIDNVDFNSLDGDKAQAAKRIYYYDESDEDKFEKKQVGDNTILSLPTMFVTKEAEEQKSQQDKETVSFDASVLNTNVKVYFGAGDSELNEKYKPELDKILNILNKHEGLGVEIRGYASAEGDKEFNEKLSNKRAISVLNYLNHNGVVRRRIVAKGYGVAENQGVNADESRRVEAQIVDLKNATAQ